MRAGGGGGWGDDIGTKVVAAGLLGVQLLMPTFALAKELARESPAMAAPPVRAVKFSGVKSAAALSSEEEMIGGCTSKVWRRSVETRRDVCPSENMALSFVHVHIIKRMPAAAVELSERLWEVFGPGMTRLRFRLPVIIQVPASIDTPTNLCGNTLWFRDEMLHDGHSSGGMVTWRIPRLREPVMRQLCITFRS